MKTDLFDYHLPEQLIAHQPAARRDESRLLVVHRSSRTVEHRTFRDLPDYLSAGDCLFRNNAAVIPARLHANRPTGGQVECLLLRPADPNRNALDDTAKEDLSAVGPAKVEGSAKADVSSGALAKEEWWCLLRPGKKLPAGATFGLDGIFTATVLEKTAEGLIRVAFICADGDILSVANRIGEMPLPPYIAERGSDEERALDRQRYQTVYADRSHQVAAAAPTAGLHFTLELLTQLAAQGVAFADLTLHVGLGTFRPISTENLEDHAIHCEVYEIPAATQQALVNTKGRRIAVGTTSVRTIEDYLAKRVEDNPLHLDKTAVEDLSAVLSALGQAKAEAGLFIYPPRKFLGVDALITNFHQPRSTLLCLVAAFLAPGSTDGIDWLREIYADAVTREYRFFSYGDAMLIL